MRIAVFDLLLLPPHECPRSLYSGLQGLDLGIIDFDLGSVNLVAFGDSIVSGHFDQSC